MRFILLIIGSLMAGNVFAAVPLNSSTDKLSYTIGNDLGRNFKTQGIAVNTAALQQGLQDGLQNKSQLSQSEKQKVVADYQHRVMKKMQQSMQQEGAANAKAGAAFLAANAKKAGVKTTASGLQYKILIAGKGPKPTANSTVTVDYEGKLLNGQIFDSSYKRGEPVTFPLQHVIKGWTEGLQLMPEGATYEFFIPAALAYGNDGVPGTIPPQATLLFKVHLRKVN